MKIWRYWYVSKSVWINGTPCYEGEVPYRFRIQAYVMASLHTWYRHKNGDLVTTNIRRR